METCPLPSRIGDFTEKKSCMEKNSRAMQGGICSPPRKIMGSNKRDSGPQEAKMTLRKRRQKGKRWKEKD